MIVHGKMLGVVPIDMDTIVAGRTRTTLEARIKVSTDCALVAGTIQMALVYISAAGAIDLLAFLAGYTLEVRREAHLKTLSTFIKNGKLNLKTLSHLDYFHLL